MDAEFLYYNYNNISTKFYFYNLIRYYNRVNEQKKYI